MPKRFRRPHAQSAPAAAKPSRRDPISRMSRFCEFLALGLVAASFFLNFPNSLDRRNSPPVSLDLFASPLQKAAVVAVHTRTPWVTLALAGMFVSVIAYRKRHAPAPSPLVRCAPILILAVLGLHCAAQGYLQSHGTLNIEIRAPAPAQFDLNLGILPGTLPGTPGTIRAIMVTRMSVPEGTAEQWLLLFAGDILYSVPILFACLLTFGPNPARPNKSTPRLAQK